MILNHWPPTQLALSASCARWWWCLGDESNPDPAFIMAKSAGPFRGSKPLKPPLPPPLAIPFPWISSAPFPSLRRVVPTQPYSSVLL